MCIIILYIRHAFEDASGSKYARVLNMARFYMQGLHRVLNKLMADVFCIKLLQKINFGRKPNFPAQIIKLYFHSYLVFINLTKMSSGGNKKTTKNTPNKNSKENSSVITMEKLKKCWSKSLNHTRKI